MWEGKGFVSRNGFIWIGGVGNGNSRTKGRNETS